MKRYVALVLAAGSSTRMGRSKQLLTFGGESMLTRTVRIIQEASVENVLVVLGDRADEHRQHIHPLRVEVIINPIWNRGIGSSLKAGLAHIEDHYHPDAVIIAVCDQPFLSSNVIRSLIEQYQTGRNSIVAAEYRGGPGVPAVFDKIHFPRLRNLPDHQGAKPIIQENLTTTCLIPFAGGDFDLDTPDDYVRLLRESASDSV